MRYRLIKPTWGKQTISGNSTYEGEFTAEYVQSRNSEGYNVYFFPNHNSQPIKGKWLSGKEVDVFNWVFVDMDLKDGIYADKDAFLKKLLGEFPITPSKVVDSGNGIHAYWRVSDLDKVSFIETQFKLINALNTDSSVWTPLQLMRVPGSLNTKKQDAFIQSEVLLDQDTVYSLKDFENLPEISNTQKGKIANHLNRSGDVYDFTDFDVIDTGELPPQFEHLLENNREARSCWYLKEGTDRSKADWDLARLLQAKDYGLYDEALPVMLNSQKAKSKGNYRREYALNTLSKVYNEAKGFSVLPVSKMRHMLGNRKTGERIYGPAYFDASSHGWRKGEVLGMIAGSGVGKTTATLDMFYEMMQNNPEKKDVYIFFSLEMAAHSIIDRWDALVGKDSPYSDRLIVISNEDASGNPRHINLQKLYWFAKNSSGNLDRDIGAIAIDHLGALERDIDISQKPNFGIMGEDMGFGTTRNIPFDLLPGKMKELAKDLNCFLIVQSQTTKERSKNGDVELGLDAAFGSAKYEWFMDYVMTFWQPLRRVEHETELRIMGWQYAKIREKGSADRIKTFEKKVLYVDVDTGKLRPLHDAEMIEFKEKDDKATKLREMAEKKKGAEYSNSDGGIKKLRALVSSSDTE